MSCYCQNFQDTVVNDSAYGLLRFTAHIYIYDTCDEIISLKQLCMVNKWKKNAPTLQLVHI
jgi:hypothetical protein